MGKNVRDEFFNIRNILKDSLKKSRFEHTLGVEFTAASLAMKYGEDLYKARIAGLLHDCAKNIPDERQLELCLKYNIPVTESERELPYLLHGKLGAYIAEHDFGVNDASILNAIRFHTTGCKNMSMLEKIIFTADYIEPGRDKARRLPEIRKAAFEDIDSAMLMIFEDTISYILADGSGGKLDPATTEAYNYLRKQIDGGTDE